MSFEKELFFWVSEGNLFRAEQVYQKIIFDSPRFEHTEIARKLKRDLVEHQQQIAGKAILSKDTQLLRAAISKLEIYNQDSTELKLALKHILFRRKLWFTFGFIIFVCVLYLMYLLIYSPN
jgi:Fe2+ transport system protein B